ncbi:MAG: hypothetical protein WC517_00695 [Patescibacteria group bacterium]
MTHSEYDLFVSGQDGPCVRYLKEDFSDLRIYARANEGDDALKQLTGSMMLVSPMPAGQNPNIGFDIGYFYHTHEQWIRECREGLMIGFTGNLAYGQYADMEIKRTPPVSPIILIWPNALYSNSTKAISRYALIVPSIEKAEEAIRVNLAAIAERQKYLANQDLPPRVPLQNSDDWMGE